jgi:uncharacterized repeat protein (TIGR01451 family)
MKHFYILILALSLALGAKSQYVFTATDIDGTTHDIQGYLDEGKPVLILDFTSDWGFYWSLHENGSYVELYNTLGQGGSGDIVVLYLAGAGFASEADVYDVDYSFDLGAGYESVDLTEGHDIPVIVAADNPGVFGSEKGGSLWVCPFNDYGYFQNTFLSPEELLESLYLGCCTSLEGDDPGIAWTNTTLYDPNCDPTSLGYVLSNNAAADLDQVSIDVYLNNVQLESLTYTETLTGCASVSLDYNNEAIQEGDEVMMVINQANANLSNDTVSIVQDEVDTVGTTIKVEVIDPADLTSELYFAVSPGMEAYALSSNNFQNYAFLEPGCYSFYLDPGEFDSSPGFAMAGSVDENDNYTDTIFFGPMDELGYEPFTLFVEGEPAVQKVWGYVFEDANEAGYFSPDFPRISNIQVNYGSLSTFTDLDGYYEFPEIIPGESVSIEYDENVWPVYTTPGSGQIGWGNYIHNFGLNSDDPFFSLSGNFDAGLPYLCESGLAHSFVIWNGGNQPTSGSLTFTYDPILTPVSFSPEPTQINGNVLIYDLDEIDYGGATGLWVTYVDISSDLLGSLVSVSYSLETYDDEGNVAGTESESITDTLFCAYDPNDKYGFPLGTGEAGLIEANTPLKYRIRFQNTGNLAATTVVIRDTLPEELDWESFEPLGGTHEYSLFMNSQTREVVWTFSNIMLPDSASDPEGSIGSLWFDIEMVDLEPGDEIENTAYIFFDSNEAIVTNTSLHTIGTPLSATGPGATSFSVFPNPGEGLIFFKGDLQIGEMVSVRDLTGRQVIRERFSGRALDVSGLHSGMYLVTVGNRSAVKVLINSVLK